MKFQWKNEYFLFLFIFFIFLIFASGITVVIYSITYAIKMKGIEKELDKEINDELVREYIDVLKKVGIENHPNNWKRLRNTFYMINNQKNVSFEVKEELYKVMVKKGCNLGSLTPKKNYEEEKERRIIESGEKGENKVSYNLKWLPGDYKVLRNIRLNYKVESQEFDSIVIGPNGIFHLEIKNHGGEYGCKIKIDNSGNWTREDSRGESGMENPSFQVERHDMVLNHCLSTHFGVNKYKAQGVIVLSNEKTIIEGAENSDIPVIKADQLVKYITNFNNGVSLTTEEVMNIYEKLQLIKL